MQGTVADGTAENGTSADDTWAGLCLCVEAAASVGAC